MEWIEYVPLSEVIRWMQRHGWEVRDLTEHNVVFGRVRQEATIKLIRVRHVVDWIYPDDFKIAQQQVAEWE